MIDFQNASFVKLSQVDLGQVADQINPLLIEGEQAFVAYLNKLVAHHVL